jgi:hypothetical protein
LSQKLQCKGTHDNASTLLALFQRFDAALLILTLIIAPISDSSCSPKTGRQLRQQLCTKLRASKFGAKPKIF